MSRTSNETTTGNVAESAGRPSQETGGAPKEGQFVKDKAGNFQQGNQARLNQIKEHMPVIASCGTTVGVVDRVEGNAIKLTKKDSRDGQHHFIPADWVERVDNAVHLKKNSKEAEQNWKQDAASCGCA